MKQKYGNKAQLLFTDTDSLMYWVETEDIYADMVEDADLYDMSNFDTAHPQYKPEFQQNKAVVGLMKDEASGNPITEFIGLRPKMYSFQAVKVKPDGTTEIFGKHRAKGIQHAAADKLDHEQYLAQLERPEENFVVNRRLGSRLHKVYGIEVAFHTVIPHSQCDYLNLYAKIMCTLSILKIL